MREHVRQLIQRARQGTDARRVLGERDGVRGIETLAADAVRLARIAAAVHAVQATRAAVGSALEESEPAGAGALNR